jgi:hypothetical protein
VNADVSRATASSVPGAWLPLSTTDRMLFINGLANARSTDSDF